MVAPLSIPSELHRAGQGFLLKKEAVLEVGLELGVHQVEVRRKDHMRDQSAAPCAVICGVAGAGKGLLCRGVPGLRRSLRCPGPLGASASRGRRRSDGDAPCSRAPGRRQALEGCSAEGPAKSRSARVLCFECLLWRRVLQDRNKPIAWDKLVLWPKEAFPCRAFLTDTRDLDVEEDSSMDECDELSEMGVDYAMLIEEDRRHSGSVSCPVRSRPSNSDVQLSSLVCIMEASTKFAGDCARASASASGFQ